MYVGYRKTTDNDGTHAILTFEKVCDRDVVCVIFNARKLITTVSSLLAHSSRRCVCDCLYTQCSHDVVCIVFPLAATLWLDGMDMCLPAALSVQSVLSTCGVLLKCGV